MIRINDADDRSQIMPRTRYWEGTMPTDALLVTIAVVTMFVVFAAALAWADRQTSGVRLDSDARR
ncbi:hypothetical protein X265_12485 [Bradyrhizobium guangdongense]|nr:hypothetical protein X265_12485 [Bradyrhizobium guangdongense]